MIICVVVNQVNGENSVPDLTQVAINNLTSAVLEPLAKSALNCPTSGRDSRDSIADLVQLVLTQQLLSPSPAKKRENNNDNEELTILVNSVMDDLNSQDRLITRLSSRIEKLESTVYNITRLPEDEIMDTLNSQDRLISMLSSRIEHLDKAVRNITGLHEDEYEYTATPLVHSCEEIQTNWPDSPSDYYTIADSNGHTRHVYCHMEELCGSDEGWMRVGYLNMSDPNEKCPEGFRLYEKKRSQGLW